MFTEASFNKTALTCKPVGFAALRVCTQIFDLQAQRLIRLPYPLQNLRFCTVCCKSTICSKSVTFVRKLTGYKSYAFVSVPIPWVYLANSRCHKVTSWLCSRCVQTLRRSAAGFVKPTAVQQAAGWVPCAQKLRFCAQGTVSEAVQGL